MARREATGGPSSNLQIGLVITALGAGVLAFAPQLNANQAGWKIQTDSLFPLMIGMIALPVVMRGFRAVQDRSTYVSLTPKM